jgi:hypothetical protein
MMPHGNPHQPRQKENSAPPAWLLRAHPRQATTGKWLDVVTTAADQTRCTRWTSTGPGPPHFGQGPQCRRATSLTTASCGTWAASVRRKAFSWQRLLQNCALPSRTPPKRMVVLQYAQRAIRHLFVLGAWTKNTEPKANPKEEFSDPALGVLSADQSFAERASSFCEAVACWPYLGFMLTVIVRAAGSSRVTLPKGTRLAAACRSATGAK